MDSPQWSEILAGHVLGDLTTEEQAILNGQSLTEHDQQALRELETTMARVQLIFQNEQEPMPEPLRSQIIRDAKQHLHRTEGSTESENQAPATVLPDSSVGRPPSSRLGIREAIAWMACAAALLVAFSFWNSKPNVQLASSLTEMRSKLMDAPDLIKVPWSDGKHPFPKQVDGDVVWSNELQSGYMRFVQMPSNDPTEHQYQLWIIDPERDDEPIDGGVFDISTESEVIVPINAKLPVLKPVAFAITIEKPGGVVVSTQERLPLLAAVK
jgi:hypothetical protein